MQSKKYVWMGYNQWWKGEGRVDKARDVLSIMKGRLGYICWWGQNRW